ncbi:alpha/beta hydrolase family protein [Corynebacterium sp.]|uniref:alpha/beta hydrolase n=1 Tax=Corynebacterium sp. TaxID=1720 RepID=UPI002A91E2A2|nr:alpha/beta hydrolase family protein [Corynebacterium sp.]MDY5785066.1 alpha/beta hydrolase family protein [Corynebacterium sp.]
MKRAAIALLVTLGTALGLIAGAPNAAAANRDWLRADATGTCDWDAVGYWVQRCDVWSPAMNRNIPVQIQPASRGGNAGLYMLDGLRATDRTSAWVHDVNAAETYADSNITLVMPVGGTASFYADWQAPATYDFDNPVIYKWETFLTQELPVYLQDNFGVARNNNSLLGLSMGGTAAMNIAAKYPGQFRQVLSFSGYLATTFPGSQTAMRAALLDGGLYNLNAMYGSVINPRRFENDPFLNMGGLRNTDVYISAGSAIPGPQDAGYPSDLVTAAVGLEVYSNLTTRLWALKARAMGLQFTEVYTPTGIHNWQQFGSQMQATKGRVLDVMNAW